jgi:hypothetical protein
LRANRQAPIQARHGGGGHGERLKPAAFSKALLHGRKIDQIAEKNLNEINQRFREFSLKII